MSKRPKRKGEGSLDIDGLARQVVEVLRPHGAGYAVTVERTIRIRRVIDGAEDGRTDIEAPKDETEFLLKVVSEETKGGRR